jgi:hypothetical protein
MLTVERPLVAWYMLKSLIFSGHMADLPDTEAKRFPPHLESRVRAAIAERIARVIRGRRAVRGIASCARGGDILFHEECRKQAVKTVIVLPYQPFDFAEMSVKGTADGNWSKRFWTLWRSTRTIDRVVLNLPVTPDAYGLCNDKIIEMARRRGPMHLIALWNGSAGLGPGGTAEMVAKAIAIGDTPDIVDPREWLTESPSSTRPGSFTTA